MSLCLPSTRTILSAALAVAASGLALSTPLAAQDGPYYVASLATPAEDNRVVAGGVAWVCKDTTCVANKGSSRPSRICRGLAREFGEITGFKADGEELEADKLARCNGN